MGLKGFLWEVLRVMNLWRSWQPKASSRNEALGIGSNAFKHFKVFDVWWGENDNRRRWNQSDHLEHSVRHTRYHKDEEKESFGCPLSAGYGCSEILD